jgi:hypothetical protein
MSAIALKVLIALVGAILGAGLLRSAHLFELPEESFLRRILTVQATLSLALFIALYVVGGRQVTSDVPGYYLPPSHAVLAGQVPFRDFPLSYAPLFPYLGAGLLSLWDDPRVFALFAILLNLLTLALWHRAAVHAGAQAAREASVLYATSGHVIVQTLLGTNQVWIAAALAGSCLLLLRGRSQSAGLLQALSVCSTKLLAFLFWPMLWMWAPRRARWLAVALLPAAAIHVGFALLGANPLDALSRQSHTRSSGNLPFLLQPLVGPQSETRLFDSLALVALAATTVWLFARARPSPGQGPQPLFAGLALIGLIFMLVSKKSYTGYTVFFMYPLLLTLSLRVPDRAVRVAFLLLLNGLLVAEPSLWFHLGGNGKPLGEWLHAPGSGLAPTVFILIDLSLLACYAWLAVISVQCVQRAHPGSPPAIPHPARTVRSP